jgi:hypothetical protein
MSKTVSFTSEKWGGSVTFSDPLTLEQEAAYEYALADYRKALDKGGGLSAQNVALLPGIFAAVEKWDLKGFPERITLANFPTRPRQERANLIAWLVEQVSTLYKESQDIPNA